MQARDIRASVARAGISAQLFAHYSIDVDNSDRAQAKGRVDMGEVMDFPTVTVSKFTSFIYLVICGTARLMWSVMLRLSC